LTDEWIKKMGYIYLDMKWSYKNGIPKQFFSLYFSGIIKINNKKT